MFLMSMVASPIFWVLTVIWYILVVAGAWKMFEKSRRGRLESHHPHLQYVYCVQTLLEHLAVLDLVRNFRIRRHLRLPDRNHHRICLYHFHDPVTGADAHSDYLLLPAVIRLRPQHPVWSGTVFLPLHFHGDPRIRQFHISALADKFPGILIIFGKLSSKIPILMEPHELPD